MGIHSTLLPSHKAFVVVVPEKLPYFVNKRLDEYIQHSEDDGWQGNYPAIAFVVRDNSAKIGFLFKTNKKLEGMGMDESEITILACSIEALISGNPRVWGNAFGPLIVACAIFFRLPSASCETDRYAFKISPQVPSSPPTTGSLVI